MMRRATLILAITAIALLFACSNTDEFYTVEIVDGVRTVHNIKPLWGDEPDVGLEFVQKIGGLDVADENYLLHKPRDIARDYEGNLYIYDLGNYRVQKFDSDGNYVSTFGKKGEGPGEILGGWSVAVDKEGVLYVNDLLNSRTQKFKPDGTALNSFGWVSREHFLRVLSTGELVAGTPYTGVSMETTFLLIILNRNGEVQRKIGKSIDFKDISATRIGNLKFADVDKNDNIYLTFINLNRIEKYSSDGIKLFTTDRPLKYDVPLEPSWREGTRLDGSVYRTPNFVQVSKGIGVDSKNRIWVYTLLPDYAENIKKVRETDTEIQLYEFHLFDSEGRFLGVLPVPGNVVYFFMRILEDKLYIIEYDSEMAVYEYKIVEK